MIEPGREWQVRHFIRRADTEILARPFSEAMTLREEHVAQAAYAQGVRDILAIMLGAGLDGKSLVMQDIWDWRLDNL